MAAKKKAGTTARNVRGASALRPSKITLAVVKTLTKREFNAAQEAGLPTMHLQASKSPREGSYEVAGMLHVGDESVFVRGTIPDEWRGGSPPRRRGRPALSTESRVARGIAKLLTIQHFEARSKCGSRAEAGVIIVGHKSATPLPPNGVRKARIAAARCMGVSPHTLDTSAEETYRREVNALIESDVLADFDRFFCIVDDVAMCAHKDATIEVRDDGVRLMGVFWEVRLGYHEARRSEVDRFYPGTMHGGI